MTTNADGAYNTTYHNDKNYCNSYDVMIVIVVIVEIIIVTITVTMNIMTDIIQN